MNIAIHIYFAVLLFLVGFTHGSMGPHERDTRIWLSVMLWPLTAVLVLLEKPWRWLVRLLDRYTMIPFYVNYWCGFYSNWSPDMLSKLNKDIASATYSSEDAKRKWAKAVKMINKKNNYTA